MRYYYFILIVFVFTACSSNSNNYKVIDSGLYDISKSSMETESYEMQETTSIDQFDKLEEINTSDRKLIKEGTIRFETENIEKTYKAIQKLTKEKKGYISRENVYDYSEQKTYEMVVRIPSNLFDNFVHDVSGLILKLESKDINVRDVTEEYVDVESRIKSKKEILNRYTELLKQAKNVAEMLDIEREIGKIQVDMESYQGRLKYLQNQVSYSTLTIIFYEHQSKEFGFFKKIGKAIKSGWNGLLWFIVLIFYLWPLWIVLAIITFVIIYFIKGRKRNVKG
jgi:hypothetical protein